MSRRRAQQTDAPKKWQRNQLTSQTQRMSSFIVSVASVRFRWPSDKGEHFLSRPERVPYASHGARRCFFFQHGSHFPRPTRLGVGVGTVLIHSTSHIVVCVCALVYGGWCCAEPTRMNNSIFARRRRRCGAGLRAWRFEWKPQPGPRAGEWMQIARRYGWLLLGSGSI